jgi:hypothetical protein
MKYIHLFLDTFKITKKKTFNINYTHQIKSFNTNIDRFDDRNHCQ